MNPEELLQRLQKSRPLSQKRKYQDSTTTTTQHNDKKQELSPESNWKKRKNEILASLQKIQGKEPDQLETQESQKEKTKNLNKDEMLMNLQLMNGEIPRIYKDLLSRFKVADIFLRRNIPRFSKLTDINNYMVLSDCKLSFTEKHVQNIVFLYAYSEEDDKNHIVYIMGRTQPKIPTEHSILTLKLPSGSKKMSVKDQLLSFMGSSRDLSGVFTNMTEEERKDILQERYDNLEQHMIKYIDQQYKEYLQRVEKKGPEKGRDVGFTMKELGEIPLGEIPSPIILSVKSAKVALEEMKHDVDKAISENKLPPVSPRKPKGFRKSLDVDFSLL